MKAKFLLFLLITAAAGFSGAADFAFTRGYQSDPDKPNTNKWSDINNWANGNEQGGTAPDYYNTDASQAAKIPGAGDVVRLWANSGSTANQVLDIDVNATVGTFYFSNRITPISNLVTSNNSTFTLDIAAGASSGGIRKERNLENSTITGDIVFNIRVTETGSFNKYSITNNSDSDLILDGTLKTTTVEGTLGSYDRPITIQVQARNKGDYDEAKGGNIVINSTITSSKAFMLTRTTPNEFAPYVGKIIIGGNMTNAISGFLLQNGVNVDFVKTNGAQTCSGNGAIEIYNGSKINLGTSEQIGNTISLQFKTPNASGIGGYFNMGGTDEQIAAGTATGFSERVGNLYLDSNTTNGSTWGSIDFGVNSTAQYFTFSGLTFNTSRVDTSKSGIMFFNYEIGIDQVLCSTKLDSVAESMLAFSGFGEKGKDYEVLSKTIDVDGTSFYEYYVNIIPEAADFAAFFGLTALWFAIYRRRK